MQGTLFRVGIVGCGYGASVLAPAFRADPRVRLVGISSQDRTKAENAARSLGGVTAFDDWRKMLDGDLDAIAVAVPPHAQADIAHAALARGLGVYAEKPLALSASSALELAGAALASGKPNMVDFNFRGVDAFRVAHDYLRAGDLGALYHVAVTWHVESYANRAGLRSWKTDEESGGGALSNFVSHSFDYLEWLLGPITSLSAGLSGMPGDARKNDASVGLLLRFGNGASGALVMSAAAYAGSGHRIEFYGENGVLRLENPGPDYMRGFGLSLGRRPDAPAPVALPSPDGDIWSDGRIYPASRLIGQFVDWALEGRAVEPDFAAGYRVQTLIDAARQSSKTGAWVATKLGRTG